MGAVTVTVAKPQSDPTFLRSGSASGSPVTIVSRSHKAQLYFGKLSAVRAEGKSLAAS